MKLFVNWPSYPPNYRICPYGRSLWKVQRQRRGLFGLGWVDCHRSVGWGYTETITFETEVLAEQWIDGRQKSWLDERDYWQRTVARTASIEPREYPSPSTHQKT